MARLASSEPSDVTISDVDCWEFCSPPQAGRNNSMAHARKRATKCFIYKRLLTKILSLYPLYITCMVGALQAVLAGIFRESLQSRSGCHGGSVQNRAKKAPAT